MSFVRVYNKDFKAIAELDSINSLSYTKNFYSVGEWELHLDYNKDISIVLNEGIYFLVENNPKKVCLLENTIIDSEKSSEVILSGYNLSGVFKRRLVLPYRDDNYLRLDNFSTEGIMYSLVESQCINTERYFRKFENLILGENLNRGEIINWRANFKTYLDEALKDVGILDEMGYDVYIDIPNKKWVFEVIKGRDLSVLQNSLANVVFAEKYDNLRKVLYEKNYKEYKNAIYSSMGNVEENDFILYLEKEENFSGMDLREFYYESSESENVTELMNEGKKQLKLNIISETLTGDIEDTKSFEYEKDWYLGDKVTIIHEKAGKILNETITEVTEVFEKKSSKLEVVFGTEAKDFSNVIKDIERRIR